MEKKKEVILITGCSGRIGFRCAELFSQRYQVIGADIFLVGHLPGIELIGIDLASPKNIQEGLRSIKKHYGDRIASVVHLAAYYSFTKGHWSQYQRITVDGTGHLLDGLLKDFHVDQFIFSSSMLVHAPCKLGETINESSPLEGKWNYPKSKILTEQLIAKKLRGKVPYVLLRIAGAYDEDCNSIPLSNQIQRIYENQLEAHLFAGDPTHGAAFVHLDDVIHAIELTVEKRKSLPEELTLLIGEEKTLSYDTLQRMISKDLYGKEWKTWSIPKPVAKLGAFLKQHIPFAKKGFIEPWMVDLADDQYALDISNAKKYLGWKPKHSLERTLPKWIQELKREPRAWYDKNKLRPLKKMHFKD